MRVPSPVGKSLSHGDVSSVVVSSGDDAWAVISSPTAAELDKKLQLNETGWSTMKEVTCRVIALHFTIKLLPHVMIWCISRLFSG